MKPGHGSDGSIPPGSPLLPDDNHPIDTATAPANPTPLPNGSLRVPFPTARARAPMGFRVREYTLAEPPRLSVRGSIAPTHFWTIPVGARRPAVFNDFWAFFPC